MKNVFIKDVLRDLRKSANRFIGMFAIVALGVFMFAGLGSTGILMRDIGDTYFDNQNFYDIRVVSTFGLNNNDILAIKKTEGVEEVQGAFSLDAIISYNSIQLTTKVHSIELGQNMYSQFNRPQILSGRYPENEDEVLVDPEILNMLNLEIGDKIILQSGKTSDIRVKLKTNEFKIVGSVRTPLYFSMQRGASSVGSGQADVFIIIPESNFKQNIYNEAYIKVVGAKDLFTYGDEYVDLIDSVVLKIEDVGDYRSPLRKAEATDYAWSQIIQAEDQLEIKSDTIYSGMNLFEDDVRNSTAKLKKTDLDIAQMEADLANNMTFLDSQKALLVAELVTVDNTLVILQSNEANLLQQRLNLEKSAAILREYNDQLVEGKTISLGTSSNLGDGISSIQNRLLELDVKLDKLNIYKDQLQNEKQSLLDKYNNSSDPYEKTQLMTKINDISKILTTLYGDIKTIEVSIKELEEQLELLLGSQQSLNDAFHALRISRSVYNDQLIRHEAGKRQLESGIISIEELITAVKAEKISIGKALDKIEVARLEADTVAQVIFGYRIKTFENKNMLRKEEATVNQASATTLTGLQDMKEKTEEKRKVLYDIKDSRWYVLDRDSNLGFTGYSGEADQVTDVGFMLPMLFFLVSSLVSLTTVTRLVEEQRTTMGTYKALGYSSGKILTKYLTYAIVPTGLGALLGAIIGFVTFPTIIMRGAYSAMYYIPDFKPVINIPYLVIGIMIATLSTSIPTLLTCVGGLKEVPASLMRPKAPKIGKKTPLEYINPIWSRLSFIYKITFRNIFRYKKRLIMTLVGVGGSTALLLTGFGLNDSMSGLVDKQFGDIYQYDIIVSFVDDATSSLVQGNQKFISGNNHISGNILLREESVEMHLGDGNIKDATMVVSKQNELDDFVSLRNRETGAFLTLKNEAAIINEQMAFDFDIKLGDELIVRDADEDEFVVVVGDICESYMLNSIYINKDYYEKVSGKSYKDNSIYAKKTFGSTLTDLESLSEDVLERTGVSSVIVIQRQVETLKELIGGMKAVIILIISIASILAFVVLLNLTNINIAERGREIATLEVLGFRSKEVNAYIYRENFIVTFLAAVLGIGVGKYLHNIVCYAIEGEGMMLLRTISPFSFLITFSMTMLFSVLVATVTKGKLNKINMLESLKSTE